MVPIARESNLGEIVFLTSAGHGSQLFVHDLLVEDRVTVRILLGWLSKWGHSEVECSALKGHPATYL